MKNLILVTSGLLVLSTAVSADTVSIRASGVVADNSLSVSPLAGQPVNSEVEVTFNVSTPGSPWASAPADGYEYLIDETTFSIEINGAQLGMVSTTEHLVLIDGFPVADRLMTNVYIDSGLKMTYEVGFTGATFSSLDITEQIGVYDFATLTSYHWMISGVSVGALMIDFTQVEIIGENNSGASDCDCTAANGPCSTVSGSGRGCPNSNINALGAQLIGSGNATLGADTFSMTVTDAAPLKPGLILSGDATLGPNGFGTIPDSAGLLCVGGSTRRGSVVLTDANGAASFPDFQGAAYGDSDIVGVGVSVSYTHWFRDPGTANGCVGDTGSSDFNFSNGWTVTWL
jgi:hypothetical protein